MKLDEAFTDAPPELSSGVKLRAFDFCVLQLVDRALNAISDNRDIMAVGAYIIAASMPASDAVRILRSPDAAEQFEAAALGLPTADYQAVSDYMDRVIERRRLAAVEVATQPGKSPQTEETPPETSLA